MHINKRILLSVSGLVPLAIGLFALLLPGTLLEAKGAVPSDAAGVMARTVGVLLIAWAVLNIQVRKHKDSPTLRAVLMANLFLQLSLIPIDPLAALQGTFVGLGSFVPNTLLHIALCIAFVMALRDKPKFGVEPIPPIDQI